MLKLQFKESDINFLFGALDYLTSPTCSSSNRERTAESFQRRSRPSV